MASPNLTDTRASYKAVFALDVCTVAIALALLALASKPTFKRLKARRFSTSRKASNTSESVSPLKTSLGTYLFLYPALLCFFLAYISQIVSDVLRTSGTINYGNDLQLSGRRAFSIAGSGYREAISALSFLTGLATIFFTVLLNGGVWIHSDHVTSNGTGFAKPTLKSKIWNTFIMLCMLVTGVAAWGRGMAVHDSSSPTALTWSNVVHNDNPTKIIYIVHQCIVIAASLSVSVQVLRNYFTTNNNASRSSERSQLLRFAAVIVPLIWLRDAFILLDIVLIFVRSAAWSASARLACVFLLIFFGQLANITILGMILWGAWSMGRTVNVFEEVA